MKNKLLIISLILTMIFALSACGSSKVEEDIWTITAEKSASGSSHEYTEIQYDDNGNVVSKKDGFPLTITYEYDENGLLIKETSTHELYGYDEITYEYDDNGLVVKESESSDYSIRDGVVITTSYDFDDNGNVARMKMKSNSSDDVTVIEFKYDDNGKIISKSESDGSYIAITDCTYDDNGNISASYTKFDDGETLDASYTYEKTGTRTYDAKNIPIAEKYRYFRENWNK